MKKLLLVLGLILTLTCSANAQPRRVTRHRAPHKYETRDTRPMPRQQAPTRYSHNIGELRIHVGGELGLHDLGGIFWHEYPYHYSIGGMVESQVSRRISLGLGAEYYGTRNYYGTSDDRPFLNSVPIYANARLSTLGWITKFFIEGRAGYAIPINSVNDAGNTYAIQGFFTGFGIGINCRGNSFSIGTNAIDVNNGFQMQGNNHRESDIITDVYLRYTYSFPVF